MSCNGCRVLRKGWNETCVLRSCLHWINSLEAQGHATLFVAKFFVYSDLMSLISSIPDSQHLEGLSTSKRSSWATLEWKLACVSSGGGDAAFRWISTAVTWSFQRSNDLKL